MTLKFSSKFRTGRGGRSHHRFDKLEDANTPEPAGAATPTLDSFNATANLPATTPDPHDRSRAASRTSTARRSVASFQNLTFSDVQQLTNVLSHAPSPAISWQSPMWATYARFTRQQIEDLPAHLRCKSTSPFSSRFWMSSASKSNNSESSDGCLCKLHSQLNVDLVRSIFAFLQKEIEDHIPAILDPLSDAGRLTRQHEEAMNALSTVPALWAAACPERTQQEAAATGGGSDGPFRDIRRRLGRRDSMMSPNGGTPRMYSMASSLQSTLSLSTSASMSKLLSMSANAAPAQQFHKRSCLACAVAQIGSSPAIIFALRVGILARSQTEPNRRGVRITFVECWMEHVHSNSENGADEVSRVMRESFELGMQLRGLYRRLSIEKERLRFEDSEEPVDMKIREWSDKESKKGAAATTTTTTTTTTTGFWVDLGHKANHAWPFKTRGRGSNLSMFDLARSQSTTQRPPKTRNSNYSMFDLARSHSTTLRPTATTTGFSKNSSTSRLRAIRAYSSSHLKPRPKTSYTLAGRSKSVSSHHDGDREGLLHAIRPKTSFFHGHGGGGVSLTPRPSLRSLSRRKTHHPLRPDSAAQLSSPSPTGGAATPVPPGPGAAVTSDRTSKATQTSPHMSAAQPVSAASSSSSCYSSSTTKTAAVVVAKPPLPATAAVAVERIEKLLPPLPPHHRARKRRHLSLPDALTMMTASPPHPPPSQQHHLLHHHFHRLHRQRGVANLVGAADPHPQMHVHPALRTSQTMVFHGIDAAVVGDAVVAGKEGGGQGGRSRGAAAGETAPGPAKPDLSLFPRTGSSSSSTRKQQQQQQQQRPQPQGQSRRRTLAKGAAIGEEEVEVEVEVGLRREGDAWGCALMKEMGI